MKNGKVILFGNTPFALLIMRYIERYSESKVVAFTVDAEYITADSLAGIPVIEFGAIGNYYHPEEFGFLPAIGYHGMNSLRERICKIAQTCGYEMLNFIHPTSVIAGEIAGKGNIILENVTISVGSIIGEGNIIWNGVNISHDARIGNYNYFAPGTILGGYSSISNNCFLGHGSIVRDNISLASKTLVGAGCYLNCSTEESDVWVPAKSVKLNKKSSEMHL